MEIQAKMLGAGGYQVVIGASATPVAVDTGYRAYAIIVRVADTQILSVTKIEGDDNVSSVVTNKSWENKALYQGEYIPLEDPITSITLNSAADSVGLALEKYQI
jgi:fructose 1,6-bisphosphatase